MRRLDKIAIGSLIVSLICFGLLMAASMFDLMQKPASKIDPRCNTAARYDAMREAYAAGRPDPCNPNAKEWVR